MRKYILIILLVCATCTIFAQTKKAKSNTSTSKTSFSSKLKSGLATSTKLVSVGNAAISIPPAFTNGTFHPLVEVGFTKPFKKSSAKQRLTVGTDVGLFAQQGLQSGLYIKPNISYNLPIYKSFSIAPKLGAGALFTKNANQEFKYNEADGTFKQLGSVNPQFFGTIGLQPSVNVYNSKSYKYNVFMSYEFGAQTPFSAISSLLPMTMIRLGLKVQPTGNTKTK